MIRRNVIRIIFFVLYFTNFTLAQDIPAKPTQSIFVNDFGELLSPDQEALLEQKLQSYNDSTSTQIAVVTIMSLNGANLEAYAQKLAETWGVGQKGKDNGILILISRTDRKIRIETGYGIEDKITDGLAKKIIDNDMKPSFKNGYYYSGINKAIDTMIGLLSGAFTPESLYVDKTGIFIGRFFIYAFLALILLFLYKTGVQTEKASMLVYAIVVGVGLLSYLFLLEAWAYPYKHGFGFWVLAGLGEIAGAGIYASILNKRSRIDFRYRMIKKDLEGEDLWNKLKRFYKPSEIDDKKVELREEFLPLRNTFQDEKRITALYRKLNKVRREWDNRVFTKRNEYDLVFIADFLEKQKFFDKELFEKESLEIARTKLYDALDYFYPKSFEVLSDKDKTKLKQDINYFNKLKKTPEKLLTPNKAWLVETCKAFMTNPRSWVFSGYTSASIAKTKEKFKKRYADVKEKGSAIDYYFFYVMSIKKIQDSPSSFLTRIPPPESSSSSYSSSGSSFSSSSSSFGGGSFGGGGASGGW